MKRLHVGGTKKTEQRAAERKLERQRAKRGEPPYPQPAKPVSQTDLVRSILDAGGKPKAKPRAR
jgi:hypothetical protein